MDSGQSTAPSEVKLTFKQGVLGVLIIGAIMAIPFAWNLLIHGDPFYRDPDPYPDTLRILAGSGFSTFEPILKRWGDDNEVNVHVTYKGSLDIMLMLQQGKLDYDAVWDGDSLWTSLGDKQHQIKDSKSIMCSPIVVGVKKSVAEELGWVGRDVSMQDILDATESRKLRVLMTSATQSNSGASAYFGFLYAFAGRPDVLTSEDLADPAVIAKARRILDSVDRTSESSGWLRDLWASKYNQYDAMFNYESHILEMNQKLAEGGEKDLAYIVYPTEGLGMADFPLSFVSNDNANKEQMFLNLQKYLLSDPVKREIEAKGRRAGTLCNEVDPSVFVASQGADARRTINSYRYPSEPVIWQALNLYQTTLRKPSFTVFALDFSGSMAGNGQKQVKAAMHTLLDSKEASKYLLQGSPDDVTIVLTFDDAVLNDAAIGAWTVKGNDAGDLQRLLNLIDAQAPQDATNIYLPAARGLELMQAQSIGDRLPAVILMTDGQSNRGSLDDLKQALAATGLRDVPVYGITFGDADPNQLQAIAELTGGRVFDGTKDLLGAFRKAKGNN